MDYWIVEAQLPNHPPVLIKMSKYGRVEEINPANAPLAYMADIDGFDNDEHSGFPADEPTVNVEAATEGQRDVTGLRLHFRSASGVVVARSDFVVVRLEPVRRVDAVNVAEALAQAEIDQAEEYQKATDGPQPDDDLPVALTVRQADKIAAIIDAAANGHLTYLDLLKKVSWFLNISSLEAKPNFGISNRSAAELWAEIDAAVPWPRHGKPRSQPDVES